MKIGILTFHCAHNYGAVLQCYALQETLKSMGHKVEVIDYRPDYLIVPYKRFNIEWFRRRNILKSFIRLIKELSLINLRKKRYENFSEFINNKLNLSGKIINNKIPLYDLYIIGSDQVWNKYFTNGYDPIFWGNLGDNNKNVISYAASMETDKISEDEKAVIKKLLNNFNSISVREKILAEILSNLTTKKINFVIDPTLLVDKSIWNNIIKKPEYDNYVLVYRYGNNKNIIRIANYIALEINAEVIEISSNFLVKNKHKTLYSCSPGSFVGYFKYARFVVTPTFHGTAFSIIFNRPFYAIKYNNENNTRVESLLSKLNLKGRLICETDKPQYKEIDYTVPNSLVEDFRKESIEFIQNSIN